MAGNGSFPARNEPFRAHAHFHYALKIDLPPRALLPLIDVWNEAIIMWAKRLLALTLFAALAGMQF